MPLYRTGRPSPRIYHPAARPPGTFRRMPGRDDMPSREGRWPSYGSRFHTHGSGRPSLRTSETDPIRVLIATTGTPGKLGLTICPGKQAPSRKYGWKWKRDLGTDLDRLVSKYDTDVLVPLITDAELSMLNVPNLVEAAESKGIHVERLQIPDGGTPSSMAEAKALAKKIAAWLKDGKNVVIHCRGGNGRTGTIAACAMIELGRTPWQAMTAIRAVRPKAIENRGQEKFVEKYALSY